MTQSRRFSDIRKLKLWVAAGLILAGAARVALGQGVTPPDTTRVLTHTVKTGDTLWDLAQTYLKDPFRWPEIFRRNTDVVENPHWIYPGEIIRIPVSELRPEVLARVDTSPNVVARVRAVASARPTVFATRVPGGVTSGTYTGTVPSKYRAPGVRAGEIEAAPYVDRIGGPRGAGEILAGVDRPAIRMSAENARYQLNDLVYLSMPAGATARLGDRYLAYALGDKLEGVGQLVVPTAILRIERVGGGQPAQARVVRQFGEVRLGQRVLVANPAVGVERIARAVSGGLTGKVIHVHQDPVLASIQHYVILSPAAGNGIAVGDEFTLIDDTMGRDDGTPAPPVAAAVVQVVRVTPYASTAIILNQVQPSIREGMPVRLTAKMPSG